MIAEQIQNLESWTPPTRSRLSRSEDNIGDFYKWYQPKCDAMKDEILSGKLSPQQTQEQQEGFIGNCSRTCYPPYQRGH